MVMNDNIIIATNNDELIFTYVATLLNADKGMNCGCPYEENKKSIINM